MDRKSSAPRRPEDLTPGWLTACLRHAGVLREANVTGTDVEQIGVGRGFAARLYRIRLRYDRPEADAPATLIGKFPAEHASTLSMLTELGGYVKEVRFYGELGGAVDMPMPRCYFAHHDAEAQSFVLLLEDLAPAAAVDPVAGLTLEQAKGVLGHVARMHARSWNRTAGLEWLAPPDEVVHMLRRRYLAALDPFSVLFAERFPHLVKVARQFGWVLRGEEFMREIKRPPQTLTHGDLHVENMLFPTAAGGRFAVVDWQLAMLSRHGATDVTRIIAMGVRPEVRRAHEDELLRHYHAELRAHGVRGYSLRALRRHYRREMGSQLLVAVVAFGSLDVGAAGMFTELFVSRLDAALADLGTHRLFGCMIAVLWPIRALSNAWLALRRGAHRRTSHDSDPAAPVTDR